MVQTAQINGLIIGLISDYIIDGVAVLQYADDTILCIEDDAETSQNMKILLYIYMKKISGLKINFNKSEIVMDSDMMNCTIGH
jgi:hypothetical protein